MASRAALSVGPRCGYYTHLIDRWEEGVKGPLSRVRLDVIQARLLNHDPIPTSGSFNPIPSSIVLGLEEQL